MWEQCGDAEFETAKVDGRTGNVIHTDRGDVRGELIVDALGWRRVLGNGTIQPPEATLSRGLEVHPHGSGPDLQLWVDPRYVPSGYGWSFPAGDELRIGIGSYDPRFHVKEPTVRLAQDEGADTVRYQGNWIPHRFRDPVEDGVFFCGDSAGHCLAMSAEGIRTAWYFGIAVGRELARRPRGRAHARRGARALRRLRGGPPLEVRVDVAQPARGAPSARPRRSTGSPTSRRDRASSTGCSASTSTSHRRSSRCRRRPPHSRRSGSPPSGCVTGRTSRAEGSATIGWMALAEREPTRKAPPEETNRWLVLVLVCLAQFMVILDATIINVALPSIQEDLGFTPADLQWVVNAYTLLFGGFLLLGGRAGRPVRAQADLHRRRRRVLDGLAALRALATPRAC